MTQMPSPPLQRTRLTAWVIAACLLSSTCAMAALGRAPQPMTNDTSAAAPAARQMRALPAGEAPTNNAYTVSTHALPSGTVVREFVTAQKMVFAVTWQGPVLPDLATYFGDHYAAFREAAQQRRAAGLRGGALVAQQSDLLIVSRGRMGRFQGHAYIPSQVPSGVSIQELLP